MWKYCISYVSSIIVVLFFILLLTTTEHIEYREQATVVPSQNAATTTPGAADVIKLFFVGDIMLGRAVESRMSAEGLEYPFHFVKERLGGADATIGNFEGVVSEEHIQTPSMGFQFSIKNEYLAELKRTGFDILSLANNHSNDYGHDALIYTRKLCKELSIFCGGSYSLTDTFSSMVYSLQDRKVGLVFVNAAGVIPDRDALGTHIQKLLVESETQIAYIHWGNEYELEHSASQQEIAEWLIDAGIDAVIGHHPHVVQDVTLYKNKPIFYSLGNFIFDQYFSKDVQEGIGVELAFDGTESVFTLIPYTSAHSRNQPQEMTAENAQIMFERILKGIADESSVDIGNGRITIGLE